jgi:hypothetical protein
MPRPMQLKRYTLQQPRSRQIRPPERVDISKPLARKRKECERLGDIAKQWLTRKKDDPNFSEEELRELGAMMRLPPHKAFHELLKAQRYLVGYPNQPIANAFSKPISKGKRQLKRKRPQELEVPRRRPPIISVDEPERSHIIAYAARIDELWDYKSTGRTLPDGIVADIAIEFGCTERQVREDVNHLGKYQAAYGPLPAADAFTPLPLGRIAGHDVPTEILKDIRDARLNTSWPSLNRDRLTYELIDQLLSKDLIHKLVSELYPDYEKSKSTTYRILQEVDRDNAINLNVARDGAISLQRHAAWRDNKPSAPGIRVQLDIRSLPTVVDYNGIHCTVRYVAIRDDFSRYRPVWMLLPSRRMDNDEEVHGQDFTARQIRQLFALYCLKTDGRMHIIFPDNGSQWSKKALGPYLQFLVAPGEEPTRLVPRRRGRPRSGGGIERDLQLVDEFLKYRPAFMREDDYRRSLTEIKKRKIPKFEEVVKDFAEFHHRWNYDEYDDRPSYHTIWDRSPNQSLSMPSLTNLAIFALTSKRLDNVTPDPGGFRIGKKGKKYEPWDFSDEQHKALANASYNGQKLSVLVFEFDKEVADTDPIVFFSLDLNKIVWHLAVEKEQKGNTKRRWDEMLPHLERAIESENGSISQLFLRKLLTAEHGPIVIDAFGREREVVALQTNSSATVDAAGAANTSEDAPYPDTTASAADEKRLTQLGQDNKVENTSLEAAGLLKGSKADASAQKKSKGRKKPSSGSSSAAGQTSNPELENMGATVSISADELAKLMTAEAELAERLNPSPSQE